MSMFLAIAYNKVLMVGMTNTKRQKKRTSKCDSTNLLGSWSSYADTLGQEGPVWPGRSKQVPTRQALVIQASPTQDQTTTLKEVSKTPNHSTHSWLTVDESMHLSTTSDWLHKFTF